MIIPDGIDFLDYVGLIAQQESQELHWASRWADDLADELERGPSITGHKLPWSKTQNVFRIRPGELTIWAGLNGHRKSMMTGQVALWAAREAPVCIASMEMPPVKTLARMARQAATCMPAVEFGRQLASQMENRICIYNQLDTVEAERILGMVMYAANELGCKQVFIDSLTKCGLAEDDRKAEKKFIDRLQWAAQTFAIMF